MRLPRYSYAASILIAIVAASVAGYVFVVPALFPAQKPPIYVIHIPTGSGYPPPNWHNFTDLSSPGFKFPINKTVTIGVNDTIEWINDDRVAHTVTSFQVPSGAPTFNSDLILPGQTFTTTLTVPGVYKYFCAWHNWLAGEITVKSA